MPAPTRPTNYATPFAVLGTKNTIPTAPTGTNKASFTEGFPPVTMQPITSGGIPPSGADFNGLFYDYSSHVVWVNAGGQYLFDAALSAAMGGYPKGMVLQNNSLTASYISLVDNNTDNFNTSPGQIGVTWGAYAGSAFSSVTINTNGGTTTLSSAQFLADIITITGNITSNVTLVFPTNTRKYLVLNKTVGSFLVQCMALGSSVMVNITSNVADAIYSDGVNMAYQQGDTVTYSRKNISRSLSSTFYADRGSSEVGGFYVGSGSANTYAISTVPGTTSYIDGVTFRFSVPIACTGASTLNAGGGAKPLIRADGTALRINDLLPSMVTTATYRLSIDSWVINGLLVPDIALSNYTYVTANQTLVRGNFAFNTAAGSFGCNLNANPTTGDIILGFDPTGDWGARSQAVSPVAAKPITIIATGGKLIAYTNKYNVLVTMSSYVDDISGHSFQLVYDGTYWRLT